MSSPLLNQKIYIFSLSETGFHFQLYLLNSGDREYKLKVLTSRGDRGDKLKVLTSRDAGEYKLKLLTMKVIKST
jgi:hypothetical protein